MFKPLSKKDLIFDQCISSILDRRNSIEECLAAHPQFAEEWEPALRLVVRLESARGEGPSPEFKSASGVRMQNLIAAHPQLALQPAGKRKAESTRQTNPFLPQRLSPALISIIVLVFVLLAGWGVTSVSARAMPGDGLYPVKLAMENLRVSMSPSKVDALHLRLAYANQRIEEVAGLIENRQTTHLDQPLSDYTEQVTEALAQVKTGTQLTPEQKKTLAQTLDTQFSDYVEQLTTFLDSNPQCECKELREALRLTRTGRDQVTEMLKTWSTLPGIQPLLTALPSLVATAFPTIHPIQETPEPRSSPAAGDEDGQTFRGTRIPPEWLTSIPEEIQHPPLNLTNLPELGVPTTWPKPPAFSTDWPTYSELLTAFPTPPVDSSILPRVPPLPKEWFNPE